MGHRHEHHEDHVQGCRRHDHHHHHNRGLTGGLLCRLLPLKLDLSSCAVEIGRLVLADHHLLVEHKYHHHCMDHSVQQGRKDGVDFLEVLGQDHHL